MVSTSKPKNPNKKTRTPPTEAFAPLILYPVKLTREKTASGFNYFLETSEEELILNRSLSTKLTKEEGITLPELKYHKKNKWKEIEVTANSHLGKEVQDVEKKLKVWLKKEVELLPHRTERWNKKKKNIKSLKQLKEESGVETSIF